VAASLGRPIIAATVLASVLGALVASMALYALLGRKRDVDAEGKGAQFFLGFGDFFLHWFLWTVDPLVRVSLRLGLTADFYNYAGLFAGVGSGVFIALGLLSPGGWALAICGVCDILDGRIARATGVASRYGDFIDSTFDRFVEVFLFHGFGWFVRGTVAGPLLAAAFVAFVAAAAMLWAADTRFERPAAGFGTVRALGLDLFNHFFYPFEVISLLLVVAMIGAVLLAKRRL